MSVGVLSLVEFLLARISEDEATGRFDMWDTSSEVEMAAQIGRDAEAKRRIVDGLEAAFQANTRDSKSINATKILGLMDAVYAIAQVYAEHPGFRDEWKL